MCSYITNRIALGFSVAKLFLIILNQSLGFELSPAGLRLSLIPILFHGGRLFYGLHIFSQKLPTPLPLFPIREMELGIYSTMLEGVGISSIGASSPPPSSPQKTFLHIKDPDMREKKRIWIEGQGSQTL